VLSFSKTIEHLSLGKWTRGVNVEVFFNIILGIGGGNSILKETEFRDEIVIVQVSIWGQSDSTLWSIMLVGESNEKFVLQLSSNIVSSSESSGLNWDLHPSLSEEWIVTSKLMLEWANSMGSKCTNGGIEQDLLALELLILVNPSCIFSVISKFNLNTFNLFFIEPEVLVWNVIQLSFD
jgi:hypothetical protein